MVVVVVGATVVVVVECLVLGGAGTVEPVGRSAAPDACCELAMTAYVPAAPATTTTATAIAIARRLQLPRRHARRVARSMSSDTSSVGVPSASTGVECYWTVASELGHVAARRNRLSARARSRIRSMRRVRHRKRRHYAGRGERRRPPRSPSGHGT